MRGELGGERCFCVVAEGCPANSHGSVDVGLGVQAVRICIRRSQNVFFLVRMLVKQTLVGNQDGGIACRPMEPADF